MSRIVADNSISPARDHSAAAFFTMELNHLQRGGGATESPTLGQLLKRVGDVRKEATGDGGETPVHQVLELGDASVEPRSLPFVLNFSNLTYSVKVRRKLTLSSVFPRRGDRLAAATASEPVPGESLFTKTKALLNNISGEARDGEILAVLQRIAQSGSIVIMSVHQPSYRILGLLDRLIFLSRGQTVYSGSPFNLPGFFSEFGHPIPENENRTEFALDLIRELEGSPGGTKSLVEFNKTWQSKKKNNNQNQNQSSEDSYQLPSLSLKEAISASISRGKLVSGATNSVVDPSSSSMVPTYANPAWTEMAVLSRRSITNSRRMPELFGIRLGAVMVTGFILATMFWQLDNSPKGVQERLGFFAFAMSTTFYTCADALPVFLQERYIFMRETAYNAYRRSSYVLSHSIVALPALVFLSLGFSAATFWAVGLDGGLRGFFFYFLIILASFWAGSSFVTFLSGVVPHVMLGYTIVVAILAYFLLFSGFFINRDRIPPYWIWFHYLSLVKFPYEAVLQNEFEDPTKCFVRGVQIFDNTPLRKVPAATKLKLLDNLSETLGMRITKSTCLTTGVDILDQQGVTDLSKWNCLWVTVAWGFLFRILFYFSLLIGSKNKRR
ncbi:ABC-2 type transporter [Parasponia andersonii]|uniref:ABC-2 type transporter n=1 Tax=Parasponia andersonii TaxID=3476 RepID=A0A2P5DPZ7_PARAD|nr:ABC-2 type transporter [Parasponia andersonii]